ATLPMLYSLSVSAPNVYHDITSGSNRGFSAAPGYDFVTGLGTPFVNFLVPALVGTPLNTITGTVFNDIDGSGFQDVGEIGLSGWQVWLGLNKVGVLAANDPSVTTGADGTFTFADLPDGTYHLREVVQTGFAQTTPNASLDLTLSGANVTFASIGDFQQTTVSGEV